MIDDMLRQKLVNIAQRSILSKRLDGQPVNGRGVGNYLILDWTRGGGPADRTWGRTVPGRPGQILQPLNQLARIHQSARSEDTAVQRTNLHAHRRGH